MASLLLKKGITDIVISPGSRNAPMINTFTGIPEFYCRNIVDERSAAYFALGLSLAKQRPVAIVCTSGTASLNYTPAVAEAFYQNRGVLSEYSVDCINGRSSRLLDRSGRKPVCSTGRHIYEFCQKRGEFTIGRI